MHKMMHFIIPSCTTLSPGQNDIFICREWSLFGHIMIERCKNQSFICFHVQGLITLYLLNKMLNIMTPLRRARNSS